MPDSIVMVCVTPSGNLHPENALISSMSASISAASLEYRFILISFVMKLMIYEKVMTSGRFALFQFYQSAENALPIHALPCFS